MTIRAHIIGAVTVIATLGSLNVSAKINDSGSDLVRVPYTTEELRDIQGQHQVYQRMKRAAMSACDLPNVRMPGSLNQIQDDKRCVEGALERAVERLGNAGITALHRG